VNGVEMRIDAHQHFWKFDASQYAWIDDSMGVLKRDFLPSDSEAEMARAGFDVCVAVQARQTLSENAWLLGLADAHPSIAGVVGWVDLQADDVRDHLQRVSRHPKLVGVRHIVQDERDEGFMGRSAFRRGIACLEECGLAYDLLLRREQLPAAAELAGRFPRQRFVLDHLAKPDIRSREIAVWERDLRRLADCPNVSAKLSGLVTEADWRQWSADDVGPYLAVAFDCFGVDRLMIGSDWPVCLLASDYARAMRVVTDYVSTLSELDRDRVLGGNARRFWNLPIRETVR
jgi:L-fuconolactonase